MYTKQPEAMKGAPKKQEALSYGDNTQMVFLSIQIHLSLVPHTLLSSHIQAQHLHVLLHTSAPCLMLLTLPETSHMVPMVFLVQFLSFKG